MMNSRRVWRKPPEPQDPEDESSKFFQWWFRRYWVFMGLLWGVLFLASAIAVVRDWKVALLFAAAVPGSMLVSIPLTWLIMGGLWKYHFDRSGCHRRRSS
jgi:hypothetical protein